MTDKFQNLKNLLTLDEGRKKKVYRDEKGILTGGVGRNLESNGFSDEEINFMLDNDVNRVWTEAITNFPWFHELDSVRQDVLMAMIFQMGIGGVKEFKRTLIFLEMGDFHGASVEMLDSEWARHDSPNRAKKYSTMMRTGQYQGPQSKPSK